MSLQQRLVRYLLAHHGWVAKGEICDLARERTGATGEHTGRRLRILEEASRGLTTTPEHRKALELLNGRQIEVEYRKNHAYYRAKETTSPLELASQSVAWFERL